VSARWIRSPAVGPYWLAYSRRSMRVLTLSYLLFVTHRPSEPVCTRSDP
jgi:hypothetical protein